MDDEWIKEIKDFSPENLATIDHASLQSARKKVNKEMQNIMSPYEHRAFAREAVAENPLLTLPVLVGAIGYQPYKMYYGARSDPSINQVLQGWVGVGEGLSNRFQQEWQSIADRIKRISTMNRETVPPVSLPSYSIDSSKANKPRL